MWCDVALGTNWKTFFLSNISLNQRINELEEAYKVIKSTLLLNVGIQYCMQLQPKVISKQPMKLRDTDTTNLQYIHSHLGFNSSLLRSYKRVERVSLMEETGV